MSSFKFKGLSFSLKPFLISAVMVFAMVSLQLTKTAGYSLKTPEFKADTFNEIRPMLEKKINNFHLKNNLFKVQPAEAAQDFDQATAFGVMDFNSGNVLMEKDGSKEVPIASLTKLMTAMVTLDLAPSGMKFTVSDKAANIQPTRMGLVSGQTWGRDELLNGLLLTSANDTAETLKEGIDQKYGDGVFVRAMNEKARFLGLKNTSFANPQGFDSSSNFSSVEDLMVLAKYALDNYPEIAQIVQKDYQFLPASSDHKQADLYNWNGLLGVYPGAEGVKIGNTDLAGVCTIVLSERSGKKVLAVVLGTPGVLQRDLWASELLDSGFTKLAGLSPVNITEAQLRQKYSTWKYFN